MAWQYISDSKFKKTIKYWSGYGGTIYLYLQYNDETITDTSIDIRWEISCGGQGSTSGNSWNHYFLLINPDSSSRQLYTIKTKWTEYTSGGYPWHGPTYTLTKKSADTSYAIPPYWLINDGYDNTSDTASEMYRRYKPDGDRATIVGGTLVTRYGSESLSDFPGLVTGPGAGILSITDNYNNTFTVEGTLGSAGINNDYDLANCFLWWTQQKLTASDWNWYSDTNIELASGLNYPFNKYGDINTKKITKVVNLNITDTSKATKDIAACIETQSNIGDAKSRVYNYNYPKGYTIKQYCCPTPAVARPTLSYNKSRLTIRENWTFSWSAGTAANTSSPIKGYEICITKNGKEIPNLTINSSGVITKGTSGGSNHLFWTNTSSLQVTCDPKNLGFAAKDKVVFWVRPYTRYGKNYDGDMLPSGWPAHTASVEATVQNAAVVNKYDSASGKWQEGIACVYKNGSWVEADSVLVYKNGNWVEST